jgi:hypothetical protein
MFCDGVWAVVGLQLSKAIMSWRLSRLAVSSPAVLCVGTRHCKAALLIHRMNFVAVLSSPIFYPQH